MKKLFIGSLSIFTIILSLMMSTVVFAESIDEVATLKEVTSSTQTKLINYQQGQVIDEEIEMPVYGGGANSYFELIFKENNQYELTKTYKASGIKESIKSGKFSSETKLIFPSQHTGQETYTILLETDVTIKSIEVGCSFSVSSSDLDKQRKLTIRNDEYAFSVNHKVDDKSTWINIRINNNILVEAVGNKHGMYAQNPERFGINFSLGKTGYISLEGLSGDGIHSNALSSAVEFTAYYGDGYGRNTSAYIKGSKNGIYLENDSDNARLQVTTSKVGERLTKIEGSDGDGIHIKATGKYSMSNVGAYLNSNYMSVIGSRHGIYAVSEGDGGEVSIRSHYDTVIESTGKSEEGIYVYSSSKVDFSVNDNSQIISKGHNRAIYVEAQNPINLPNDPTEGKASGSCSIEARGNSNRRTTPVIKGIVESMVPDIAAIEFKTPEEDEDNRIYTLLGGKIIEEYKEPATEISTSTYMDPYGNERNIADFNNYMWTQIDGTTYEPILPNLIEQSAEGIRAVDRFDGTIYLQAKRDTATSEEGDLLNERISVGKNWYTGAVATDNLGAHIVIMPVKLKESHEEYSANYLFESKNSSNPLPQEILDRLPESLTELQSGAIVIPTAIQNKTLETDTGIWNFLGWDEDSKVVENDDITFKGLWEFTAKHTITININYIDESRPSEVVSFQALKGERFEETLEIQEGYEMYDAGYQRALIFDIDMSTNTIVIDPVNRDYTINLEYDKAEYRVRLTTTYLDGEYSNTSKSYWIEHGSVFNQSISIAEGYTISNINELPEGVVADLENKQIIINEVEKDYDISLKFEKKKINLSITVKYEDGIFEESVVAYTIPYGDPFETEIDLEDGYRINKVSLVPGVTVNKKTNIIRVAEATEDINITIQAR